MERKSLESGVAFCAASSMLLGIVMAILVVIEKYSYTDSVVSLFFYSLLLWCTLGVISGFLGATLIGIPVSIVLNKLKIFHPFVFLIIGAVAGYFLGGIAWVTSNSNPYIQVMFVIYGSIGALAFWYGASSNKPPQPTPKNGAAEL
jgi:hypothetical protein